MTISQAEFETYLHVASLIHEKPQFAKQVKEIKEHLERVRKANGGARQLARADQILRDAEAERAKVDTHRAKAEEAIERMRSGMAEEQAKLEQREHAAEEKLREATRREKQAAQQLGQYRKAEAAANEVKARMESLAADYEAKLKAMKDTVQKVSG